MKDDYMPRNMDGQEHWEKAAWMQLRSTLNVMPIVSKAKNAILFLGDGMSLTTVTAARIYSGQMKGKDGEESSIIFDKFPYVGLSKTYSVNKQVSDSASTATAYLGGVKTNTGLLGLTAAVKRGDCLASLNQSTHVHSMLKWAQDAGMSTGIVTTTRVTHASPAGGYAHIAERNWENDNDVAKAGKDPKVCQDIAMQLITGETGRNLNVILGGGRRNFLPRTSTDEEFERGKRRDGKNLIKQWLVDKSNRRMKNKYVWDKKGLIFADNFSTGLFESSHMRYHMEMNEKTDPTLAEMTEVAIDILKKNPNGYILFVEGGRIDHGHHDTKAHLALDETVQMAEAVAVVSAATSETDTLMLVTADHSHTMTISGYSPRGNSIFDAAGISNVDGMLYTTLSYANGPGYKNPKLPRKLDIRRDDFEQSDEWMDDVASFVSSRGKASSKRKSKCQRHDISEDNLGMLES
ncbi:hypothetical protein J437_LFUL010693 [Ladona fulva]|uniref:Alkaline phosphatase n=1 Tax=Ladona fulva TaxID=123851 RepID=A0A8K0P2X0_LADFU|nr:hypothetical protein J437_LFUL010693 [Ladona fulva]